MTAGATLLVYALVQGPEDGWTHRPIVVALVLGARMANRMTTRATLIAGFAIGIAVLVAYANGGVGAARSLA